LAALALLPVIWWLIRLTPPKPRDVRFPPTRLLLDFIKPDETPAHGPWWLTLIRLAMAAAVILALAGPSWQPDENRTSLSGNTLIILDNGFAAAPDWDKRLAVAGRLAASALENNHLIAILPAINTNVDGNGVESTATPLLQAPAQAASEMRALMPVPLPVNRETLFQRLTSYLSSAEGQNTTQIVWISDGTALSGASDKAFADVLKASGLPLTLFFENRELVALASPVNGVNDLTVMASRIGRDDAWKQRLNAYDFQNRLIASAELNFEAEQNTASATMELPTELRNDIARLEIEGATTAVGVQLLDDSFRRKVVGILSGETTEAAQPLLSPSYYVRKALAPFADLRAEAGSNITTSIDAFLNEGVSVIVMTDVGTLLGDAGEKLAQFINSGGLVIRFAGPRLASSDDPLVPVELRSGGRILGGSLSWDTPQRLADFAENSPFSHIELSDQIRGETTVRQQVLAEPDISLDERSWAYLEDGTPLVTARQMGDGWLVLFHVTADAGWSDLPLSGLFVDMLRATLPLSRTVNPGAKVNLANASADSQFAPYQTLNALGRLTPPDAMVQAVPAKGALSLSPVSLPGIYGTPERYRTINLLSQDDQLVALDTATYEAKTVLDFAPTTSTDLKPYLLVLAFILLLTDALAVLVMQGVLKRLVRSRGVAGFIVTTLLGLALASPIPGFAQDTDVSDFQRALEDTNVTRLAYVITGNSAIDDISRQGLSGLSQFMAARTSLEAGYPRGIDPAVDELAFYPLIYWPIDPDAETPSKETMARIDAFMKLGGTVLFDTRDQLSGGSSTGFGTSPATEKLREMLASLDVPALEPVPQNHVLTRSFYLLSDFPGRFSGSALWVEAQGSADALSLAGRTTDGVSSILITANDFAGAWAVSVDGRSLLPTVPGDPRQREMAFRVGVNIAMYTLTGNYKADQVHLPALLERLGQ
ncbi:MAG: DUF4159 domain-containing protein, partial [Rhizobiales bacterium]|nr:DUF4159 domain-containing protein [Hyphomicrobiales bacterium]